MSKRPPLTTDEAHSVIAEMRAKTPRSAAIALLRLALKRSNLSAGAAEIYQAELSRLENL